MALARTTISIEKSTLERFYRAYPSGRRSQIIQQLIERELADMTDRLSKMAEWVESDPAFQVVHQDGALWEQATANDGLRDG